MQGDQVLVEVDPPKADGRLQGRILRDSGAPQPHRRRHVSLRRSRSRLPANVVIPFDERMTQPILIPPGAEIPPAAASVHAASRAWPRGALSSKT